MLKYKFPKFWFAINPTSAVVEGAAYYAGSKPESVVEEKEDLSNCKNSWMVFEKDGNYQLVIRKTEKKGQWKLLEDKKTIKFENEGDDTNGFQILKLKFV